MLNRGKQTRSWIWRRWKAGEAVANSFDADESTNMGDMGSFPGQCLFITINWGCGLLTWRASRNGKEVIKIKLVPWEVANLSGFIVVSRKSFKVCTNSPLLFVPPLKPSLYLYVYLCLCILVSVCITSEEQKLPKSLEKELWTSLTWASGYKNSSKVLPSQIQLYMKGPIPMK